MAQRGRPRKITTNGLTDKDHNYILCSENQTHKQGHIITTKYDMDLYDNLDDFLEILYRNNEISEEEKLNVTTVYYKEKIDEHESHQH